MTEFGGRRPLSRSDLALAGALAVLTFAAHAWTLARLRDPLGQFDKYTVAAAQLLAGTMRPERVLDFSPLYLGLSTLLTRLSANPAVAVVDLQAALVALACGGMFLLLRGHFPLWLAAAGAGALALDRSVLIHERIAEPEILLLLLIVLLFLFLDLRTRAGTLCAGTALAASILTRPSYLSLALLIPLHLLLANRGGRRALPVALFLAPACAALALLLVVFPAYRGEPGTLMNPGVVFFEGNQPLANGTTVAYPPLVNELAQDFPGESDYHHAVYRILAEREAGRDLSRKEVNSFWAAKASAFIGDHPGRFLAGLCRKAFLVLHGYRWHDTATAAAVDAALSGSGAPAVPRALLSALAVTGVVAAAGSWRSLSALYLGLASQAGVMILTYASDRQRVALLPLLVFFAVVATWRISRGGRRAAVLGAGACLLSAALGIEHDLMRDNRRVWENHATARAEEEDAYRARRARDFPAARAHAARMVAAAPWLAPFGKRPAEVPFDPRGISADALVEIRRARNDTPTDRLNLALLLIDTVHFEEAGDVISGLQREGSRFEPFPGRPPDLAYYLGLIASRSGRDAEAVRRFEDALAASPGNPDALSCLAVLTNEARYRAALARYFDRAGTDYSLGRAAISLGRGDRALAAFRDLTGAVPEFWEGSVLHSAALGAQGFRRPAVAVYLEAMRKRSDPVMLPNLILPTFRSVAGISPPEAVDRYWYGLVLAQYGEFEQARDVLEDSLRATGQPAAAEQLRRVEQLLHAAQGGPGPATGDGQILD